MTRGLALVNFRREPVYLSDEALDRQPKFHRYAIGCRKLPDLRRLRGSMLGRALHTDLDAWSAQVRTLFRQIAVPPGGTGGPRGRPACQPERSSGAAG